MPDIDFQKIVLNLIPKKEDEPVVFYASQYETARPFIADLMWGESEFAPGDSCWAEIDIRKVDDNLVVITDDVTIDNNEVSVVLPVQALTCVGKNFGQVKIYADVDTLVCALNFILEVQPDPLAGGVTSETAIDNLATQIDEIAQAEGYLKAEDVAPVALSGSYNDLTDKPTIPDKLNDLSDVDADPPLVDDYSLFYNRSQQKWKAMPGATYVYVNDTFYRKSQVDTIVENATTMIDSSSGPIATISTAIANEPLNSISVDANATTVYQCGKNLIPDLQGVRTSQSIYIGQTDGTTYPMLLKADQPYHLSFSATGTNVRGYYKTDGGSANSISGNGNFSVNSDMWVQMWLYADDLTAVSWFQIEVGSQSTSYEECVKNTYSVSDIDNIRTLEGKNNIFTDYGNTTASCKDNIQHYIDERT